jgi:hypothetical protein
MATSTATGQVPATAARRRPRRPGLRRELGFIGLLRASGGSITGPGWLFGAQVYFWAQHVALPADKIEALTRRGAVAEEPALKQAA